MFTRACNSIPFNFELIFLTKTNLTFHTRSSAQNVQEKGFVIVSKLIGSKTSVLSLVFKRDAWQEQFESMQSSITTCGREIFVFFNSRFERRHVFVNFVVY